jgi:hypothetical protein
MEAFNPAAPTTAFKTMSMSSEPAISSAASVPRPVFVTP